MDRFQAFEKSLDELEREAIFAWLGAWFDSIRRLQIEGTGDEKVQSLELNLSRALGKAVECREIVWRGLSAVDWRPEDMKFLRRLIDGPDEHELISHDSATTNRLLGLEFTRIGPEDEERHLAILLTIEPITARYLRPFKHAYCDESEVVLLRRSRYLRTRTQKMQNPKANLEFWHVHWKEIA